MSVLDCIVTISFGVHLVLWFLSCFLKCGCVYVWVFRFLYGLYCIFCIVSYMYIYSYLLCRYLEQGLLPTSENSSAVNNNNNNNNNNKLSTVDL